MSTGQRVKFWVAERFAMIVAVLVLLYLFLPVAYTFVFSFNNYKKSNITWNPEGSPTFEHWMNPCGPPGICEALGTSIRVGAIATIVATILGTMLAFALVRHSFKGKGAGNVLVFVPMATPEIVLGASLLTIFVQGFNQVGLTLGFWTIVIAHIMFCLSFVVVTVKARRGRGDVGEVRLEVFRMGIRLTALLVLRLEALNRRDDEGNPVGQVLRPDLGDFRNVEHRNAALEGVVERGAKGGPGVFERDVFEVEFSFHWRISGTITAP